MPGVARVSLDSAGGMQLGGGQAFVRAEGALCVLQGDAVASHGLPPHSAASMVGASAFVRISGIPVCRAGDLANCGHASTGSNSIRIGA